MPRPEDTRECDGYPGLMPTVDVDERTIELGLTCGLMQRAADGVIEITEKGSTYLASWLHKRLEPCSCGDPGDCGELVHA